MTNLIQLQKDLMKAEALFEKWSTKAIMAKTDLSRAAADRQSYLAQVEIQRASIRLHNATYGAERKDG